MGKTKEQKAAAAAAAKRKKTAKTENPRSKELSTVVDLGPLIPVIGTAAGMVVAGAAAYGYHRCTKRRSQVPPPLPAPATQPQRPPAAARSQRR